MGPENRLHLKMGTGEELGRMHATHPSQVFGGAEELQERRLVDGGEGAVVGCENSDRLGREVCVHGVFL